MADQPPEQTFKRNKYPGLCIPDAEPSPIVEKVNMICIVN